MKGKHHGGVYPATVSVSVGYNFFLSHICLFMVFVITLWQVSQAGQEENGRTTNSLVYSQTTYGLVVVFGRLQKSMAIE